MALTAGAVYNLLCLIAVIALALILFGLLITLIEGFPSRGVVVDDGLLVMVITSFAIGRESTAVVGDTRAVLCMLAIARALVSESTGWVIHGLVYRGVRLWRVPIVLSRRRRCELGQTFRSSVHLAS